MKVEYEIPAITQNSALRTQHSALNFDERRISNHQSLLSVRIAEIQREWTRRIPSSTAASNRGVSLPTRSVSKALSTVMIWETFTTEGFERPDPLGGSRTFPGASARRRLEVMTAAMTVLMRLSLKLFAETKRRGRR